jgi:hypothetical protein
MAIEHTLRYWVDYIIKLSQISPIPQYMGLKSLRYHYWCPFNHESEGISIPWSNLSYFLGTTGRGAPRMHYNMKDGVNCRFPDLLWRHSSYGQVGSPSNPDLWRKRPHAFRTFTKDHRTWPSRMGKCATLLQQGRLAQCTKPHTWSYTHTHGGAGLHSVVQDWRSASFWILRK